MTSLFGGSRVSKDNSRVVAYGDMDELNAHLGLLVSLPEAAWCKEQLSIIQQEIMSISSELASPAKLPASLVPLSSKAPDILEQWIDQLTEPLPPLNHFIIPGGNPLAAKIHVARTICRRAERSMVSLAKTEEIRSELIVYLNRLSDYLFTLARSANHRAGNNEVLWK